MLEKGHNRNSSVKLKLGYGSRRCRLKILKIKRWRPFCSAEPNHFSNFGKGVLEEQVCKFILNLATGLGGIVF